MSHPVNSNTLLKRLSLLPPTKRYLLAFSGGLDSTALLHLLASIKDQIRFLDIAKGSTAEFATQTYIAMDINYLEMKVGREWIDKADHIIAMITKLQQSLQEKINAK